MYHALYLPETMDWDEKSPPKPEFFYMCADEGPNWIPTKYFMSDETGHFLTQRQCMFLHKFDLLDIYMQYVRRFISDNPNNKYTLMIATNKDRDNHVVAVPLIVEHNVEDNTYHFIALATLYILPGSTEYDKSEFPASVFVYKDVLDLEEIILEISHPAPIDSAGRLIPPRRTHDDFGELYFHEILVMRHNASFLFFMRDPRDWKRYDIDPIADACLNINEIFRTCSYKSFTWNNGNKLDAETNDDESEDEIDDDGLEVGPDWT